VETETSIAFVERSRILPRIRPCTDVVLLVLLALTPISVKRTMQGKQKDKRSRLHTFARKLGYETPIVGAAYREMVN